jgi:hypothetical protein
METTIDNENLSALFLNLVLSQSSMALVLLGRTPHPQTGETLRELDSARMLIDQLEMLEVKTRGNLTAPEAALLKQSLTTLRLAFVEAVNEPPAKKAAAAAPASAPGTADTPGDGARPGPGESTRKFSKKY